MFLVSSCRCLCLIHWSQVLSREWRCCWSNADTTSEWSTMLLPTKIRRILEVWWQAYRQWNVYSILNRGVIHVCWIWILCMKSTWPWYNPKSQQWKYPSWIIQWDIYRGLCHKARSFCRKSLSCEIEDDKIVVWLWNLTGVLTAELPILQSQSRAIG